MKTQSDIETFNIPNTTDNDTEPTLTRRTLVAASLAAMAGLHFKGTLDNSYIVQAESTQGSEEEGATPITDENAPATESVEASTGETTVDASEPTGSSLEAGAEVRAQDLVNQPREAIVNVSTLHVDHEKSPEDYGTQIVNNMQLMFEAGNTDDDKNSAAEAGLSLEEYANQTYRDPLHEGMFKEFASGPYEAKGMAKLRELECYFSRRFESDSRYTTTIEVEAIDTESEHEDLKTIVQTLHLKIKNTIPDELGEDPAPYEWAVTVPMVLAYMHESQTFAVNLNDFDYELLI